MLGKLLKYDITRLFKKVYIFYIALIPLALLFKYYVIYINEAAGTLGAFVVFVSGFLTIASAIVMILITPILDFHRSILSKNGYFTVMLPAKKHEVIISKVISYYLTTIFAVFMVYSSLCVASDFRYMPSLIVLRFDVLVFITTSVATQYYLIIASMSLGFRKNSKKILWSILFYFIINTIMSVLTSTLLISWFNDYATNGLYYDIYGNSVYEPTINLYYFSISFIVISAIYLSITYLSYRKGIDL